jgi:L-2-hydroxyglutarate oxidase
MNETKPSGNRYDIAIIGGGIVGLATARAILLRGRRSLVVLEAEDRLAAHQTGHNSGVIHSGLYYKPGSLKALNCTRGREAMYRYCADHGIACERCGKLVVAVTPKQVPALEELFERGTANGLAGLKRIRGKALKDFEPHVAGCEGLVVPDTGIVDFGQVAESFARDILAQGGSIRKGFRVRGIREDRTALVLSDGCTEVRAGGLVNCAGLQSDRVARLAGMDPGLRIIPFRGEYYALNPDRHGLVRNLIYPVPDPRFPFLGVHFTRMIHGGVEAGPNAVLAFRREGYRKSSFSIRDTLDLLAYPGFWRMAGRYGRTGLGEMHRSFSPKAFVRALQKLVPDIALKDLKPHGAGVRAQAVERDGRLVDDFRILDGPRMIHVLNAPSPAATASLSIGETLADKAASRLGS